MEATVPIYGVDVTSCGLSGFGRKKQEGSTEWNMVQRLKEGSVGFSEDGAGSGEPHEKPVRSR